MTDATQPSTLDAVLETVKAIPFRYMTSGGVANLIQVLNHATRTLGHSPVENDRPTVVVGMTKDGWIVYAGTGLNPYFGQKPLDKVREDARKDPDLEAQLADYLPTFDLDMPTHVASESQMHAHWNV